jgi:hypothetical protein
LGPVVFTPRVVLEYRAHPDQARVSDLGEIETAMRADLLATLAGDAQVAARRSLVVREHVSRAEALYGAGRAGAAAKLLARTLSDDRPTALDPLIRRRVLRIFVHSLVVAILGEGSSARLRELTRKTRSLAGRDPVQGSSMTGRRTDALP